ncbi:DUF2207 domain-containing protein [Candidatus Micrarchaeota archaeon]|nr:DUF2207 domain-containing protein [Candidatus Micrarchaeota archaeon]
MNKIFVFLLIIGLVSSFSIENYYNEVQVLGNGDLQVYEKMTFYLDEQYNEGYRSIRPLDYGQLGNIQVLEAKLDGQDVIYTTAINGENAEIIWKKTHVGTNVVELRYILKDRVEIFDDFARVCYEHYGAGWGIGGNNFHSVMVLPEESRGKEMHFEIYSSKKPDEVYVDDLKVVVEMDYVPSGNYIGGCYLFDKGSVNSSRIVNGSAYEILQEEREQFGSEQVFGPDDMLFCCFPIVLLTAIAAGAVFFFHGNKKIPRGIMSILPPSDEEPVFVSALVRNEYKENEIMASTLLDLINKGIVGIIETQKEGSVNADEKERTILKLLKKPTGLKACEEAVLNVIFNGEETVDLDAKAKKFDEIKSQGEAGGMDIEKNIKKFRDSLDEVLKEKDAKDLKGGKGERIGTAVSILMFYGFLSFFYLAMTDFYISGIAFALFVISLLLVGYSTYTLISKPRVKEKYLKEYSQWKGFSDAIKSGRMEEYPPSSVIIWGKILVYATALGLADKVKKHLSELDSFLVKQVEDMERISRKTTLFYTSAFALSNLSKYGSRSGPRSSGFSSRSSGGWSSGGGGGFSGGSSGGGGFR